MNAILNVGKYLFAIPFAVFGLFHLMGASAMAEAYGVPGGAILVYLTGIALIAATVSILIGKMDKLATVLLSLMLLLFVLIIHLQPTLAGDQSSMGNLLKDLMLSGAALIYAKHVAKDNAVIG